MWEAEHRIEQLKHYETIRYRSNGTKEGTVTEYNISNIDVNLETVNLDKSVVKIPKSKFKDNGVLKRVLWYHPSRLTRIEAQAFEGCVNLEQFALKDPKEPTLIDRVYSFLNPEPPVSKFPESLTEIGASAFKDCRKLSHIVLPEALTTIGVRAFYHSIGLEIIDLRNTKLKGIADETFSECARLTTILLPTSLETIGDGAFRLCLRLEAIPLLNLNVNRIGKGAFIYCNFDDVNLQNTKLTSIEQATFMENKNLKTIEFPVSLTTIGSSAFKGCENLSGIPRLGNSVINIESQAFALSGLVEIDLSNTSLTIIEPETFAINEKLETIVFPSSLTDIREGAFSGCVHLENVTLHNGLQTIGKRAFNSCISLTTVVIPDTVTEIGHSAFKNCIDLHTIRVPVTFVFEKETEEVFSSALPYELEIKNINDLALDTLRSDSTVEESIRNLLKNMLVHRWFHGRQELDKTLHEILALNFNALKEIDAGDVQGLCKGDGDIGPFTDAITFESFDDLEDKEKGVAVNVHDENTEKYCYAAQTYKDLLTNKSNGFPDKHPHTLANGIIDQWRKLKL